MRLIPVNYRRHLERKSSHLTYLEVETYPLPSLRYRLAQVIINSPT